MQKFKHDFEKLIAFKRKGMWAGTGAAGADTAGAAGADKAGGADLMQVLSKSKAKAKRRFGWHIRGSSRMTLSDVEVVVGGGSVRNNGGLRDGPVAVRSQLTGVRNPT